MKRILAALLLVSCCANVVLVREYLWAIRFAEQTQADHLKTIEEQRAFIATLRQ